jgi:hypothetical protein
MLKALEPTQDPDWVLRHQGYSVLNESAVEPRFALGKGGSSMRAPHVRSAAARRG